jgi:glucosamine-6-phosphate deaminase
MEVVIVSSRAEGAALVGGAVHDLLFRRPDVVLGLATGSSPAAVYANLAERCRAGQISFRRASAFGLDEYVGLPAGHSQSCSAVIARDVTGPLGFDAPAVRVLDGNASDLLAECKGYEAAIESAGGVDLQLLGLGTDGHIGFNEPGSSLASRTRPKTLAASTRHDNARFFGGDIDGVPRHALTQGVATVLGARHLVLVAWGEAKADAVAGSVEGPVTAMMPGSALQLHPHVTVIVDEAAAARLKLAGYYRETWADKADWQQL